MASGSKGFATRWGLIFALVGASVGTGNIWRFPRMVALNGGGAFVVAWTIFLVLVSIPCIIAEMILGRSTRHGCPGAFKDFAGEKYTWMGAFLSLNSIGICAYYTGVMGWSLRYVFLAIQGFSGVDTAQLFDSVASGSVYTVGAFIVSLLATALVISQKISKGVEKACKFMIPALFLMLAIVAARALTLPGSIQGVKFLFDLKPEYLFSANTWLNALTQSAWSVGPGWGLVVTYGVYVKGKSDVALNEFMQGFGDNSAALLAGFAVLPAVFALAPSIQAAEEICASGNTGLTFINLCALFPQMPLGHFVGVLFFIALFFAAFSSNLVIMLTGVLPLMDAGWSRAKATWTIFTVCLIWGIPSAWNVSFLNNQDWVFGMTLLIGGVFTCYAIIKYGAKKAREKYINIPENELHIGPWWDICIKYVTPITILVMFVWWTWQSIQWYPDSWWNPLLEASTGTFIVQGGIYALILWIFNKKMADSIKNRYIDTVTEGYPEIPEEYA